MNKHTIISPTSCMGLVGIDEGGYHEALKYDPDSIAADAGSLDPGPYYLGSGMPHVPKYKMKEDCRIIMEGIIAKKTPVVMGTAGGSGGKDHIQWHLDIINEVAKEIGRNFKVAIIETTLDKDYLKKRAGTETIKGCNHDGVLTEEIVENCGEIVAQIGVEAIVKALELNPDIVLAGRANDNACFAAEPVRRGFDKGIALHLGKIVECGSACGLALPGSKIMRTPIVATIEDGYFTIEPATDDWICTVRSISGHELYERTNPMLQLEPGGILDMSDSLKTQVTDKKVKVSGSKWIKDNESYKVKIEGAQKVGYRCLFVTTARDPEFIKNIDWVTNFTKNRIINEFTPKGLIEGKDYYINFRIFGKNATMGILEPNKNIHNYELGVTLEVIAKTQELAHEICYFGKYGMVWCNYPGRTTISGNVAYSYSPSILDVGEVYRLTVHHILPIDENQSLFPVKTVEVG